MLKGRHPVSRTANTIKVKTINFPFFENFNADCELWVVLLELKEISGFADELQRSDRLEGIVVIANLESFHYSLVLFVFKVDCLPTL